MNRKVFELVCSPLMSYRRIGEMKEHVFTECSVMEEKNKI